MNNKSFSEFCRLFYAAEVRHSLFANHDSSRNIWDMIRYVAFNILYSEYAGGNEISFNSSSNRLKNITEIILMPINILRILIEAFFNKKTDLLFLNYDRRSLVDGKIANISTYPVIKQLKSNYKICLLEPSLDWGKAKIIYGCNVIPNRSFHLAAVILSKFIWLSKSDMNFIGTCYKALNYDVHKCKRMHNVLISTYRYQVAIEKLYKVLLAIVRPRLLLHCDTGSNKGLVRAAHINNIKVIDMQHSLMSSENVLYNYPNVPEIENIDSLSDYIFTFGKYWDDDYKLPVPRIPVGFPFLEDEKNRIEREPLASGELKNRCVTIISSMNSGKKLESLVIKLAQNMPEITFYYKLRPEEYSGWRNVYSNEFVSVSNIEVIDTPDIKLYDLFNRSFAQIGINSTALIEGITFGLQTYIYQVGHYTEMIRLINDGYAVGFDNYESIHNALSQGANNSFMNNSDDLIAMGSHKKINQCISSILNDKMFSVKRVA